MKEDWKIQAAEMLEATGFKDVTINDSNAPIGKGIHEMGTARMGHDPKTSVLINLIKSMQLKMFLLPMEHV